MDCFGTSLTTKKKSVGTDCPSRICSERVGQGSMLPFQAIDGCCSIFRLVTCGSDCRLEHVSANDAKLCYRAK